MLTLNERVKRDALRDQKRRLWHDLAYDALKEPEFVFELLHINRAARLEQVWCYHQHGTFVRRYGRDPDPAELRMLRIIRHVLTQQDPARCLKWSGTVYRNSSLREPITLLLEQAFENSARRAM